MSDCNCKAKPIEIVESKNSNSENKSNGIQNFLLYSAKTVGFIFSLILLPFINLMIIKFLFQTIILNKKVDLRDLLEYYFKNRKSDEKEEDEDYLDLEEDEVEMLNVEEIK